MRVPGFGPGALVTAAFVGPGTVTTCTLAGAGYGLQLVWALLAATLAALVLQDMAVRLGVAGRTGLGDYLRMRTRGSPWHWPLLALVVIALLLGNSAYEGGNLAGAALGASALLGEELRAPGVLALAAVAGVLLLLPGGALVRGVLALLVGLMAAAFLATLLLVGLPTELPRPALPSGSVLTVVALVGTTIVPYNLFLHAGAARDAFAPNELGKARVDSALAITLGGLVSASIMATAAGTLFASGIEVDGAAAMSRQLQPLAGPAAAALLGAGLLAAGLTSAITAPLATAMALAGLLGLAPGGRAFRAIALLVLAVGVGVALSGVQPLSVILLAQAANGLLLPLIAAVLLVALQNPTLGRAANRWPGRLAGVLVVALSVGLGLRLLLGALGAL